MLSDQHSDRAFVQQKGSVARSQRSLIVAPALCPLHDFMRFTASGAQPVALLGTSAPQQVVRQRSQDSSIPSGSRGPVYPQEAATSTLQRKAKSAQALSKNRHIDRDPLVEDFYKQLLEKPEPSRLHGTVQPAQAETAAEPPTELIFQLDRRGEGWGEEIFPTLTVIRRPVVAAPKRDRNRSKRPPPWTVSSCCCSLSCSLSACVCLLAPVEAACC